MFQIIIFYPIIILFPLFYPRTDGPQVFNYNLIFNMKKFHRAPITVITVLVEFDW